METAKSIKTDMRRAIRAIKKETGAEHLVEKSVDAVRRIEDDTRYRAARTVMLYHPLWDEVDTRPMIQRALASGKRVILPTVHGDDIVAVEVTAATEWREGDFGILEPVAPPYEGAIDLIVVPGVAFDRSGGRLGRGKGYYDRFLPKHPEAVRIGICFDFQLVESVPHEPFDLTMHAVIAEGGKAEL